MSAYYLFWIKHTLSADYVPEWEEGVVGGVGGREEDLEAPNIRGRGL